MTKRKAKAKKNSGQTGTAKATGTTSKTPTLGSSQTLSSQKKKETEASDKVAAALKRMKEENKSAQGSEWSSE